VGGHDPYDVDEDMGALVGYEAFVPIKHGVGCRLAIVLGPDTLQNGTYRDALVASCAFQSVRTCTHPTELRLMNEACGDDDDVVVLILGGFDGPLRVTLFHVLQLYMMKRTYADFSMIYTGSTNGSAWTIVLSRQHEGTIPYTCKWVYSYRIT
jgi:hypothetical protein